MNAAQVVMTAAEVEQWENRHEVMRRRVDKLESDSRPPRDFGADFETLSARLTALESQLPGLQAWRSALDAMQRSLLDWQKRIEDCASLSLKSAERAPRKRASVRKTSGKSSKRRRKPSATARKRAVKRRSPRRK